jgi:magnesium transporter
VFADGAIYRDGRRTAEPLELARLDGSGPDGALLAWVGLDRPTEAEFTAVAQQFGLPEAAVAHSLHPHQRPRLERYGDTLFCVLRTARYIDESETFDFGEVLVFLGPNFVVTVRRSETPDLSAVRRTLEARPELLRRGPVAVLHAVMDQIMDDYGPIVAGVENDIDEIEDEVFNGSAGAPRRVYRLSRAVIAFQRATKPLPSMFDRLIDEPLFDEDERRALRDVQDRALQLVEQADAFRQVLQNILNVNLTLETKSLAEMSNALTEMSNDQNEVVKKISAWAAILFAPTSVGTIYGMNFQTMPELGWELGYPFALALMVLVGVALYGLFKKQKWI